MSVSKTGNTWDRSTWGFHGNEISVPEVSNGNWSFNYLELLSSELAQFPIACSWSYCLYCNILSFNFALIKFHGTTSTRINCWQPIVTQSARCVHFNGFHQERFISSWFHFRENNVLTFLCDYLYPSRHKIILRQVRNVVSLLDTQRFSRHKNYRIGG